MDEFEKWLDSQPILLQKNLSERDEAMKRDAFTAGRKSGYEAGLRRAAEIAEKFEPDERHPHVVYPSDAILAAIEAKP